MTSSRIKKNGSRDGIDTKRTEHNFWCFLCHLSRHMIHLSIKGWLLRGSLLVTVLTLRCLLILRIVIRYVVLFAIAETLVGSVRCTSLHGSVVGRALAGYLLTTLLLLLLALLELVGLRVLTTISLIRWPLVPLLETWLWVSILASVTSRGLPLKPHFLGIHFLALIVNHNSTVHQCLEIRVGVRHELELKTIV
jgi:hypothetical protein